MKIHTLSASNLSSNRSLTISDLAFQVQQLLRFCPTVEGTGAGNITQRSLEPLAALGVYLTTSNLCVSTTLEYFSKVS